MKLPKIAQKGPFIVELEPGRYSWCSCGLTKTEPFCDTTHRGTEFRSVKFELTEKETVYLCGCKHTSTPPYCDDTHEKL